jgi:O-antigen/teichoic acid export membrane protein
MLAANFCALGLPSALPRQPANAGEQATLGLLVSVAPLPLIAAICLGYGMLVGADAREAQTIATFALAGAFLGQVNVLQCLYVVQRRPVWAPLASIIHLAGIAVAARAPDLLHFSALLLASRALGCAAGFVPLHYGRVGFRQFRRTVVEGACFLPLDLFTLVSEQAATPVLSLALTRPELGLFGLMRQFLTVADTPGWSYIQSRYPAMISELDQIGPALARSNERLSWIVTVGVLAAAVPAALLVYRLPVLLEILPVVMLPLPARYLSNFCDQALRARGQTRECMFLGILKTVASLALLLILARAFGMWGAVVATAAASLVTGLLYRWRLRTLFPCLLPAARVWRFA